jgi:cell volume regulation protein A
MDGTTLAALFIISVVLLIGFAGQIIFKRTNIPDVIWHLLFGIVLSLLMPSAEKSVLTGFAAPFGTLALVMILFKAGMDFEIAEFSRGIGRGTLMTVLVFALSVAATTGVTSLLLGWPLLYGILLGAILGDTSETVLIPIITRLKVSERAKSMVAIETALTDVLVIVLAIAAIEFILSGSGSFFPAFQDIATAFTVGIAMATIFAVLWLSLLPRILKEVNSYLLALTAVLLLYVVTEFIGGSGAIAALVFGLALGNIETVRRFVKLPMAVSLSDGERAFYAELNFFVRTFFFVYLGAIFVFSDLAYLAIGLLLVALFVAARLVGVRLSLLGSGVPDNEQNIIGVMASRGLAAAVICQLPAAVLPPSPIISAILPITLYVIFFSIAATVVGTYVLCKPAAAKVKKPARL